MRFDSNWCIIYYNSTKSFTVKYGVTTGKIQPRLSSQGKYQRMQQGKHHHGSCKFQKLAVKVIFQRSAHDAFTRWLPCLGVRTSHMFS